LCKNAKVPLIVTQDYYVASKITVPYFATGGRNTAIAILGEGGYAMATVRSDVADYVFSYATQDDTVVLRDFRIINTGGGGITFGECGGCHIDNMYFNEIASGCWAIYQSTGTTYTVNIDNSRFWKDTGFYGGVLKISAALNVAMRNSFISQQRKDGDVIVINNTQGFFVDNCQFEGGNFSATNQVLISFTGSCYNSRLTGAYFEGAMNTCVKIAATGIRNLAMENCYCISSNDPNCIILDASSGGYDSITVNNINFNGNVASAGTSYLIHDPNNIVTLTNYSNTSITQQSTREWKQKIDKEVDRGTAGSAYYSSGATISQSFTLPEDGSYLVFANVRPIDKNHGITGLYQIIFDDQAYDYTVTELLGTTHSKGPVAPTSLTVSVDKDGEVTIEATASTSGNHEVLYSWQKGLLL